MHVRLAENGQESIDGLQVHPYATLSAGLSGFVSAENEICNADAQQCMISWLIPILVSHTTGVSTSIVDWKDSSLK